MAKLVVRVHSAIEMRWVLDEHYRRLGLPMDEFEANTILKYMERDWNQTYGIQIHEGDKELGYSVLSYYDNNPNVKVISKCKYLCNRDYSTCLYTKECYVCKENRIEQPRKYYKGMRCLPRSMVVVSVSTPEEAKRVYDHFVYELSASLHHSGKGARKLNTVLVPHEKSDILANFKRGRRVGLRIYGWGLSDPQDEMGWADLDFYIDEKQRNPRVFIISVDEYICGGKEPINAMAHPVYTITQQKEECKMASCGLNKTTAEVYEVTSEAIVVETHLGHLIRDDFFSLLFVREHKETILAEAKRLEEIAKKKKEQ